ncbi:MAG: hypothetical protein ABI847_04940 [Anaerolineales bacterium]
MNIPRDISATRSTAATTFREPGAAQAAGYVLAVAGLLVAAGLSLHPLPTGGFEESASQLSNTPLWGAIHAAIAFGFVLCALGGLLALAAGGQTTRRWTTALFWGALTVGMVYFTGVSLINGWVMHPLAAVATTEPALYAAMNHLLVGFGWLGNPLFLLGLTGLAAREARYGEMGMPRWLGYAGLLVALLAWGRGVGSATGLFFLEPLIVANIPAFMWLAFYGLLMARLAREQGVGRGG